MLGPTTNTSLKEMALALRALDNFAICGHRSPDGDALGSTLALGNALMQLGKSVTCLIADDEPLAPIYEFLPGVESLVHASEFEGSLDAFIAVDVSALDRLSLAAPLFETSPITFVIDHHETNDQIAQYQYVDPDAASASLLVWELSKELLDTPSEDCALCAYTGLSTDTGNFCFQNADIKAFKAAADMVSYGADPSYVANKVFNSRTLASLKLEQNLLENMQIFADSKGILGWISLEEMAAAQAQKSDTEPLIDCLRSLSTARVACLLREQENSIRGSLRAKDDTDVAALAQMLNGGGHKASAGFTLHMPLSDAIPFMIDKITEILS